MHNNIKKIVFKNLGDCPSCPICYDELVYEDTGFLRCSHVLCDNCFMRLPQDTCPICREPLIEKHIEELEEEIFRLTELICCQSVPLHPDICFKQYN